MSMYTSIISGLRALFAQVGAVLAPQRSGARRPAGMALVATLVLVGLVACSPASSGSGSEQQPVPVSVSYTLSAPDELTVTVTADATAPIAAELTVTVTLTPAMDIPAATVQNMSVMLSADARSSTATFASLAAGSWTLSASGTGVQLSLPTQATVTIRAPLTLGNAQTGTGDASLVLTIADPLLKVYGISIVDTGTAANSSMITITAARSDHADDHPRRDQSSRLRQGPVAGIADTASPASGSFMDGTVWLFLPGDDGDDLPSDLPANYAINSCSTPADLSTCTVALGSKSGDMFEHYPALADGSASPLARSLSYILMVDAPDDTTNWRIQTSEITFPRLPAGITTRARTTDEGGPARGRRGPTTGTGQGYYLVYDPTPGQLSVGFDRAALSPDIPFGSFIETNHDDSGDLFDIAAFEVYAEPQCNDMGGLETIQFTPNILALSITNNLSSGGSIRTRTLDDNPNLQIYCIEMDAILEMGGLVSDQLQFTLNPPASTSATP